MFCPNCGASLQSGDRFCPMCGADVSSVTSQEPAVSQEPEIIPSQEFTDTGNEISGTSDGIPNTGGQPTRRSFAPLIAVIIAAAAAAAVLFFVLDPLDLNLFRNHSESAATAQEQPGKVNGGQAASDDGSSALVPNPDTIYLNFISSDVSDYPIVRLYYSATNEAGEPITLTDPVANVTERLADGTEIERTVRSIMQLEGRQGLSIDLVADKSASMEGSLADVQRIMSQFVSSLDYASGDSAEIIAFDTFVMYMCTYTQDPSLLQNGIANMSTYGDTALYDALYTAVTNAAGRSGARCVIGFTDGEDNSSVHTMQDVVNLAVEKEVPIFLIGTGGANYQTLTDLCMPTGGTYWDIAAVTDLSSVMAQIYANQKQLYCVEYETDQGMDAYAERTVFCTVFERNDASTGNAGTSGNAGSSGNAVASSIDTFTPVQVQETQAHTSRYEVIRADVSWTEANDLCIARGGHLVTITSQEEQDQMIALAEQAGIRFVWIGGYTSVRDNAAYGHWITGEPFEYTAWYPGEPSRNDQDGTPEFYLMLWNVNDSWTWNDERNDPIRETGLEYFPGNVGYICEYEN